jgi:hypothetical protein
MKKRTRQDTLEHAEEKSRFQHLQQTKDEYKETF